MPLSLSQPKNMAYCRSMLPTGCCSEERPNHQFRTIKIWDGEAVQMGGRSLRRCSMELNRIVLGRDENRLCLPWRHSIRNNRSKWCLLHPEEDGKVQSNRKNKRDINNRCCGENPEIKIIVLQKELVKRSHKIIVRALHSYVLVLQSEMGTLPRKTSRCWRRVNKKRRMIIFLL